MTNAASIRSSVPLTRILKRGKRIDFVACFGIVLSAASAYGSPPTTARPKLAVIIIVDQLRADYLTRFEPLFGDDGFKRIERDGAHFANAYYTSLCSATAPGHATVSTGTTPRHHGIVANKWFAEPGTIESFHAVHDPNCEALPHSHKPGSGRSPHRLLVPTIGDQLKLADRRSRVVSIALKDRSAIFLGGRLADTALWWDFGTGRFVSSSWYGDELPNYVKAHNDNGPTRRFAGYVWNPIASEEAIARCYPVEPHWNRIYESMGHVFPHTMPSIDEGYAFNIALGSSPAGNDLVIDLVELALKNESLGTDDAPDLLCIGLSSNDLVGHFFGPQSPEVMDMTMQTDKQIARILSILDAQVGRDQYILALTGDHGVSATPPVREKLGIPGGIVDESQLARDLNAMLTDAYFKNADEEAKQRLIVLGVEMPWVYFNMPLLSSLDTNRRNEIFRSTVAFSSKQPGIDAAYGPNFLTGVAPPATDESRLLAWNGYNPQHAGQVCIQLAPYWEKKDGNLAGHSSGSRPDRHVPILLYGPGIGGGRRYESASPEDIAVTLSALLGIEAPIAATGRVLHEAIKTR